MESTPLYDKPLDATRTLLISGFKSTEEYDKFLSTRVPMEQIAENYTIPRTNFMFLIFYDVRDSMSFYRNFKVDGLQIRYTISKYEVKKADDKGEANLQGSINVLFRGITMPIDDTLATNIFKNYGAIRELRNCRANQKTVEYFDIRCAQKAFEALNNSSFGEGTIKCRWVWDVSVSQRAEYLRLTDELLKGVIDPKEVTSPQKRQKVNGMVGKKNPVLAVFDRFIGSNILEIERVLRR